MLDGPNTAKFSIENLMKPSQTPKRFNPSPEPYLPYPGAGTQLYPIPAPVMSAAIGDQGTYQARYGGMIERIPASPNLTTLQPAAPIHPAELDLKGKFHEEESQRTLDSESPSKPQGSQPDYRDQILREHREQLIREDTAARISQHWGVDSNSQDSNSQDYRQQVGQQVSQHSDQNSPRQNEQTPPQNRQIPHQHREQIPVEFGDQLPHHHRDNVQQEHNEHREQVIPENGDDIYREHNEKTPPSGRPTDRRQPESRPISPAVSETHSDGNGGDGQRRKKSRTSFSTEQIAELESRFRTTKYLAPSDRGDLAEKLGLSDQQVKTWFQNRRMKDKRSCRDSTEVPVTPPHTTAPYTTALPTCSSSGYSIGSFSSLPAGVGYPFTTSSQLPGPYSEHPIFSTASMYPINMTSQRIITPPMGSPGQQGGSPHPTTTSLQMLSPHMIPPMTVSSPYMPRSPFPMMPI